MSGIIQAESRLGSLEERARPGVRPAGRSGSIASCPAPWGPRDPRGGTPVSRPRSHRPRAPRNKPLVQRDRRGYSTVVSQRIGKRVVKARKHAELTQEALAKKIGISREYVARIEGGHHEPSLTMLVKVAKALGVTAGSLID